MIPIVKIPLVVEAYSPVFKELFTVEGFEHFQRYVSGLLLSDNKTVEAINRLFIIDERHQSSLNRFLNNSPYDIVALNDRGLTWLNGDPSTAFKDEGKIRGVLALDDTLFEHYGDQFDHIAYLHDHSKGHSILAHNLVNLHYVDDKVDYPVDFRLWEPAKLDELEKSLIEGGVKIKPDKLAFKQTAPKRWKQHLMYLYVKNRKTGTVKAIYKTKIDLAMCMLKYFFDRHGDKDLPVAFDSWYTLPEFCKHIDKELKKGYVGALKPSEEILLLGWEKIKASDFAERLKKRHSDEIKQGRPGIFVKTGIWYKGKKECYHSYCAVHHIIGFEKQLLAINFKEENLSDSPKFVISNRLTWHAEGITRIYRHRWHIEAYHEEGKEEGPDKYELRNCEAIKRHIAMIIVAYSYLQRLRFDQSLLNRLEWKPKESEKGNSLRFRRRALTYEALTTIIYWFTENMYNQQEIRKMMNCLKQAYK